MIQTDAEIVAAVDAELRPGDARSAIYRQALIDVLRYKLRAVAVPRCYVPGSVEFDAYYSGNERGWVLWRKLLESGVVCETSGKRHD